MFTEEQKKVAQQTIEKLGCTMEQLDQSARFLADADIFEIDDITEVCKLIDATEFPQNVKLFMAYKVGMLRESDEVSIMRVLKKVKSII